MGVIPLDFISSMTISHDHIEQMTRNSFATIVFFSINCANVWRKVFSVVEVVFNNAHTAYNFIVIQAKIATVFCFSYEIGVHTVKIRLSRNAPFAVKTLGGGLFRFRTLPY